MKIFFPVPIIIKGGRMFSKILVATDGSSNAIRGAKKALELAKLTNAEVTLVYVAYVPGLYKGDISSTLMESFIDDGKKILKDTEAIFKKVDYPVKKKLIRDKKPAVAICALAKKFDLLVVGTKGLHRKQEKAIGSISNCIVHCAPCSILLVK